MLLYLALILTFFPRLIEVSVISIVVQFIGSSSAFNGDIQGLFGDCLIKVSVISIIVQFIPLVLSVETFRVYLDTAYFVKNWKYYSKIIFKCVNNVVKLIFNGSFFF